MAESPLLKHCPSVSPLCFEFIPHTLNNKLYRKPQLGTPFLASKSIQFLKSDKKRVIQFTTNNRRRRLHSIASFGGFLGGIFKGNDTGESTRQQYAPTVSLINDFEAQMSALSDLELRDKTSLLKERAQLGESLDSLLPVTSKSSISIYLLLLLFFFLFYVFPFQFAALPLYNASPHSLFTVCESL